MSVALWFHPLVWRTRSAHASTCEQVSDAVAAAFLDNTEAYSRTLARVAINMFARPPALCGIPMARVSELSRRLTFLKRRVFSAPPSRRRIAVFALMSILGIALLSSLNFACREAPEKSTESEKKTISNEHIEDEQTAQKAADSWLNLVDSGKYDESWNEAAGFFKRVVTKESLHQSLNNVRKPLGKLISRNVIAKKYATSLPGVPDGEYVVIQYKTSFENKKQAIETVTPMKDEDGQWRVSGYYIR